MSNALKVIGLLVLIWLAPLTDELRFWDMLGDNWNFWWGVISRAIEDMGR